MLFPPMIVMICVTFTALVQRVIALVKAISTGTDLFASILQLVVAICIIVLALIIVVNSFKTYVRSKRGSQKDGNEDDSSTPTAAVETAETQPAAVSANSEK